MKLAAVILPMASMSEETVDSIMHRARADGLVACNARQGPFRISFFPADRVPQGWSKIGVIGKGAVCTA